MERSDRLGRTDRLRDSGSAAVDFVLVGALATLLFLGVLQLGTVLHVRNTVADCASEGARYGGLADRSAADGAARTQTLLRASLGQRFAGDVSAARVSVDGLPVVRVTVRAPLPVIGLLGPRSLTVVGHGLVEGA